MRTLLDVRNRLGAVVRAVPNRRRRREAAARGSFADHLLAFPSAIEFEPERAKVAARPLDTPPRMGMLEPPSRGSETMDSGTTGPSDAANGTDSRLLRDDWNYVEAIPLDDFEASDFALLDAQRPAFTAERQAEQILRIVRGMADDPSFGYRINTFRHCLQSATMAHRAGKDEDYVAMAFLHDIGFDIAPATHGSFAAALLGPYVSPEMEWLLANHAEFQNLHCRNHPTIDRFARDKWRGHPAFAMTAEFCARFDQNAMDPDYDNMPMEAFEPMVRRLFAKAPREAAPPAR